MYWKKVENFINRVFYSIWRTQRSIEENVDIDSKWILYSCQKIIIFLTLLLCNLMSYSNWIWLFEILPDQIFEVWNVEASASKDMYGLNWWVCLFRHEIDLFERFLWNVIRKGKQLLLYTKRKQFYSKVRTF